VCIIHTVVTSRADSGPLIRIGTYSGGTTDCRFDTRRECQTTAEKVEETATNIRWGDKLDCELGDWSIRRVGILTYHRICLEGGGLVCSAECVGLSADSHYVAL
jgi:hypothetical protein